MHGLTRELYGRTIRGVKGAGGGVGEKKKLFTWKIVREKKMHKAKQAGKHEPAHMKKKKKKIYTLKQKLPQPLHFCDVGKNAGVLKHTIANPIKKSWSTLIERSGKGFSLPLALTQDWYAWSTRKIKTNIND